MQNKSEFICLITIKVIQRILANAEHQGLEKYVAYAHDQSRWKRCHLSHINIHLLLDTVKGLN